MASPQKGFFKALFDWDFNEFITLRFLKVIYIVITAIILLSALIAFIALLASGEAGGIFLAIVGVPIGTLLYLVVARIYLEVIALFFRINESTTNIEKALAARNSSGPTDQL